MTAELRFRVTGEPGALPKHLRDGYEVTSSGCWLWRRSLSHDGYGWTSLSGKTYQAHRLMYRLLVGEPPSGRVLDHICRVRHCVNPAHLEPVTPSENVRRSPITPAGQSACLRCGSDFGRVGSQRRCLKCKAEYERERRRQKATDSRARRARARAAVA